MPPPSPWRGSTIGGDPKARREACLLALTVARAGEQADPRVPAPTALRPVLGFSRLSAASYGLIERVVDDDHAFRARVAGVATESEVGRAGWLWLTRPDGWETDPASSADARYPGEASARLRRERAGAEAAAARHRREAEEAEAARRQAEDELAVARAEAASAAVAGAEVARLEALVDALSAERSQLVRRLKAAEAEGAALRRDLRVAREATRQAEAELLARTDGPETGPDDGPDPQPMPPAGTARRGRRRPPALPAGLAGDSPEAHQHLVTVSGALLVVDGYNVARTAWPDLTPEEERRRVVALLEEHRARTGVPVVVVFDGDSHTVAPAASRTVRVQFSPTGTTADDAISALVAALPADRPAVVVSSDREVADDALRQGAAVIGARAFLAAVGR